MMRRVGTVSFVPNFVSIVIEHDRNEITNIQAMRILTYNMKSRKVKLSSTQGQDLKDRVESFPSSEIIILELANKHSEWLVHQEYIKRRTYKQIY